MTFSIFTPFHKKDISFLKDLYETLLEQTYTQWEWVLVPNGEGLSADLSTLSDPRVKIYPNEFITGKVGPLKKYACSKATGDYLLEVDWDDLLTPDCLEKLNIVAEDSKADFLYANFAQVDMNWKPLSWSPFYGWQFRNFDYKGHKILEAVSPSPWPSNFNRIWFTPNHPRCWKRSFYERIGGHNASMTISDDHDILCRTYLEGSVVFIDDCLYIYRVHGKNTWLSYTKEIQDTMWDQYDQYFERMFLKWSSTNKLRNIDLGGALNAPEGFERYDRHNADIVGDLNERWNLEDNSVGYLRAHDLLEHLKDPIHVMNEAYRVLAHGGFFDILVPSALGEGGFCDPTHVSFWVKRSFRYYTEKELRKYIEPECKCKFQEVRIRDIKPWDDILYVQAHLIADKDGPRVHGANYWR